MYPVWLGGSYMVNVWVKNRIWVNLHQLVSFNVVWLLDSSHYLGLPIIV